MTILLAALAGVAIGLSLGALGGGGSILAVPVLVYLLGQDPLVATTGSLVVVGTSAATGAAGAGLQGQVRLRRGLAFGGLAVAGAAAGAVVSTAFDPDALLAGFAGLLLVVATVMLLRQRSGGPEGPRALEVEGRFARFGLLVGVALLVGVLTGLFGVGGGFLVVPALVLTMGMEMSAAVGTSLVVIVVTSVSALVVRLAHGVTLDWLPVLVLTGAAVLGSALGSRVAASAGSGRLSTAFAVLLVAVALWTGTQSVLALA